MLYIIIIESIVAEITVGNYTLRKIIKSYIIDDIAYNQ